MAQVCGPKKPPMGFEGGGGGGGWSVKFSVNHSNRGFTNNFFQPKTQSSDQNKFVNMKFLVPTVKL